jgi:hypothetical protein
MKPARHRTSVAGFHFNEIPGRVKFRDRKQNRRVGGWGKEEMLNNNLVVQ